LPLYGVIDDEVSVLPPLLLGSVVAPLGAELTTTGAVMIGVVPVMGAAPAEVVLVTGVLPAVVVMPVNGPVSVVVAPVTEVAPGDVPVTLKGVAPVVLLVPVVPVVPVLPVLVVLVVKPVVLVAAVPVAPVATSGVAALPVVAEPSLLPPQPNRADAAARHATPLPTRMKEPVIALSKSLLLGVLQCRHVDAAAFQALTEIKPAATGTGRCRTPSAFQQSISKNFMPALLRWRA